MTLEWLIEALEKKHESNDTETCQWCGSGDCGVDRNGERTDDADEIDGYHFLDCDDDCLERLLSMALAALRQALEHPADEPPDSDRPVLARIRDKFVVATCLGEEYWLGAFSVELHNIDGWRELPRVIK